MDRKERKRMSRTAPVARPGLVLTRKPSEAILIGEDITITVDRIQGGRVILRVEAEGMPILRGELVVKGGTP